MSTPELTFIPLLVGLTQVAKMAGLPKNLTPAFTIVLAIFLGNFLGLGVMEAIVFGLSACGLYSAGKATVNK